METYNDNKESKRPLRVLVSGGGTGGHIFPALAIAGALKKRLPDTEILFVGAEGRMEMERVPAAGFKIVGLPVAGFDRKRLWRNAKVLWKLAVSLRRARRVLDDFRPDIAIGVGGYASGPMLKAAQKQGVATLLQEQNSYAGVTNKLLGDKAKAICVAYEGMERFFPADKIVMTGNPVRSALLENPMEQGAAKKALGFDPSKPLVLIVGGSLGARTINDSIASGLDLFAQKGINLMWQTGKLYADEFAKIAEPYDNVHAMPFISDMGAAYAAADLVVSRAGAGTISELELLGKAAILVPSPNVAEDHQRKNAMALVDKGAAVMVTDAESRGELAKTAVRLIDEPERRAELSRNIAKMALRDSANKIVDKILEIVNRQN